MEPERIETHSGQQWAEWPEFRGATSLRLQWGRSGGRCSGLILMDFQPLATTPHEPASGGSIAYGARGWGMTDG